MNELSKRFLTGNARSQWLFISIAAMLLSLFLSRTALSCSMIAFVILSFLHKNIKNQLAYFLSSPLLWGISLLFFLPLVSGIWSGNKESWFSIIVTKAPLLFMPLAFAGRFDFSGKQWKQLAILLVALVTAASAWSVFIYMQDEALYNEGYLKARSIPTLLENDRVRFSLLVTVAILICGSLILEKSSAKNEKILLGVVAIGLVGFLHLLAVRTGLISFYIIVIGFCSWLLFRKKRRYALIIIILLLILPVAAYFLFPSFRNRIHFFRYELPHFSNLSYIPGGNDASRVISLKAGWELMNKHPLTGVGLGDIDSSTKNWYAENYPQVRDQDIIAPSSEWLIYGLSNGWPGFLLFTAVMLIPFLLRQREYISWILLSSITGFSFLFDIGLEVQFGVFIYTIVILCWWKLLEEKTVGKN